MDVSADGHRTLDRLHVDFARQDLLGLVAQVFHFILRDGLVVL